VARAVEENEEEDPAIKYGELALISDWEKLGHRCCCIRHVKHELGHRHFTAADERANAREQTEGDEKSTNKLNPAAGL